MKTEFRKDRTDFYAKALVAVAALLGALTFLRVAGFLAVSSEARVMAARMDPKARGDEFRNDMNRSLASAKASAEELKKSNLFVKTPPRQFPVNEVLGILGDEALVNGKWCKAGDSVADAKIVAIEPTKVRIVWDGQEKEFSPIGSAGSGPAGGPPSSRSVNRSASGGNAPMVVTKGGAGPKGAGRTGGSLSDADRERIRQRWQNMNPQERERAKDEMRQKFGSKPR